MRWLVLRLMALPLFALTLSLSLSACRQTLTSTIDLDIALSVQPTPPTQGDATLRVNVRQPDGALIEDAVVRVRGDMNHAGMIPVIREAHTSTGGEYEIPFEWTMGGDWFVEVVVTLPDGRVDQERFEFTVSGEPPQ